MSGKPVVQVTDLARWVKSRRVRLSIRCSGSTFEVVARAKETSFRFHGEDLPMVLAEMVDKVNEATGMTPTST